MIGAGALLARAALCQLVGALAALGAHQVGGLGGGALLGVAGLAAGLCAAALALPRWWWLISAVFPPALGIALVLRLPALVYAFALGLCLLLFGAVMRSRVPLWLSGAAARSLLVARLPGHRPLRVIDLGAGTGGLLLALWRSGRCAECVGIEWAPLPWLLGWLRLRLAGCGGRWRYGSLWRQPLTGYDLVYAFLSPAAMPELWRKANAEMDAGSWLVSYRFEIPGVPPDRRWPVSDDPDDALLLWVMPGQGGHGRAEPQVGRSRSRADSPAASGSRSTAMPCAPRMAISCRSSAR